jgi:hypothetical protein
MHRSLASCSLAFLALQPLGSAQSSFTGISHEVSSFPYLDGVTHAVVRVYADLANPNESLYAAYTLAGGPATVLETSDPLGFWQTPLGGDTSLAILPAVVELVPEVGYDSYVTIGAPDASGGNGLLEVGIDWASWNNGGPLSFDDGSWFAIPDTTWTYPVGGRVLLAQLTVTAGSTISGRFSLDTRTAPGVSFSHHDVAFFVDTAERGVPYCYNDAGSTACPCGNPGVGVAGCGNSTGAGGALGTAGTVSLAENDLVFQAHQLRPNQPVLLFAGLNAVNGGSGILFGDGLRCAGGSLARLGVKAADTAGSASWGPGLASGQGWFPGEVRRFQAWYRDPVISPCGSGFNLTNGIEVAFQ